MVPGDESYVRLAMDTVEELDWCLDQLETIQTHRSVSDMASLKVRNKTHENTLLRQMSQNENCFFAFCRCSHIVSQFDVIQFSYLFFTILSLSLVLLPLYSLSEC